MPNPTKPATASLTRQEYDAIDALSYSGMKELSISPAAFKKWVDERVSTADTAADQEVEGVDEKATGDLVIGSAFHARILQPDLYDTLFASPPEDAPKRPTLKQREAKKPAPSTLEAIAFWDEFDAVNAGKTLLTKKQAAIAEGCAQGILRFLELNDLKHIIDPARSWLETQLVWTEAGNLKMKCQVDIIDENGWIWDLKSIARGLSDSNIKSTIFSRSYHWQAAHYLRGAKRHRDDIKGFRDIFVDKAGFHDATAFTIDGRFLEWGEAAIDRMAVLWNDCRKNDSWPSLADQGVRSADLLLPDPKAPAGATISF